MAQKMDANIEEKDKLDPEKIRIMREKALAKRQEHLRKIVNKWVDSV